MSESAEPTVVALWIQPRASRDAMVGERDGAIAIRLQAPPVDGVPPMGPWCVSLPAAWGCPPRDGQLVRGLTGRRKWVSVGGLESALIRQRLLAG